VRGLNRDNMEDVVVNLISLLYTHDLIHMLKTRSSSATFG